MLHIWEPARDSFSRISDILTGINAPIGPANEALQATVQVDDMVAIIHMVTPITFAEYITTLIVSFLKEQITTIVEQMDNV